MVSNLEIHPGLRLAVCRLHIVHCVAWFRFFFFFPHAIHRCVLKSHHVLIFKKQNKIRKKPSGTAK